MPVIKVDQRGFFFFVLSLYLIIWSALEGMCLFSSPVTYAAVKRDIRRLPQINNKHHAHCALFSLQIRQVSLYCLCLSIIYLKLHFSNWFLDQKQCVMSPRPNLNYRTWRNVPFPHACSCKQPLIWDVKELTYFCYFHIDSIAIATTQK